ncbi:hypothetical protein WJX73_009971 [Symbiochloris irregularis]|uniref:Mitogen-activated protein kinase kinase kinase 1 n=1 Tax=Symbiochloris irregularis TaxID=706552 RepID=A0AAW1NY08_9CHLO
MASSVIDLTGGDAPLATACPHVACAHAACSIAAEAAAEEVKPKRRKRKVKTETEEGNAPEPTPKKERKEKKEPKPKVVKEQRIGPAGKAVKYSAKPCKATKERMDRALPGSGHRMFLLSRATLAQAGSEGGAKEQFDILGATGNVYKVTVAKSPSCTCPDAQRRGDLCKHYLYVMIRVLRLAADDDLVWQRGLLTEEVDAVLSGQRSTRTVDRGVMASAALVEAHRRMCGTTAPAQPADDSSAPGLPPGQRPITGDCPVCYDDLDGCSTDQVVFCKSCGNNCHKQCFERWSAAKRGQGVTCVWCRAPWADALPSPSASSGAYVNLASHTNHYGARNTSLNNLYGATNAAWIRAHAGEMSMRHAANLTRVASGRG